MKEEKIFEALEDIDEKYIVEARQTTKKKKNLEKMKWMAVVACFSVCLTSLFAIYFIMSDNSTDSNSGSQNTELIMEKEAKKDVKEDSDSIISKELKTRIQELQEAGKLSDFIGWIVIEDRIYVQNVNIDITKIEKDIYLGRASEFIGNYQSDDGCDGDVYSVVDMQDMVVIMLDNGGIVCLMAEDRIENDSDSLLDKER